jgi:hypothetical protein
MKISIMKSKVFPAMLALFVSIFTIGSIQAQTDVAEIIGAVNDAQGAAIAGATVTLTNPSTGFTRTVQSNDNGIYNFPGIPPGTYTITVERTGFKKSVQTDVQAPIASTTEINVILEIGDVAETVTVTSNNIDSIINTQDASIGNTFQPIQIQQLPTDSRNVADLLSLQPGVTREGYVNGGRSDQANITLDGIDVNDQQLGTAFFSVLRATSESVQEFRVTTTNANADQGRSSGAQISLLTINGTNEFHGAAFWLPRRTFGSANNFFNNSATVPQERPNIDRDVFGGAIGGPIVKDKFFFFYSYEGWRQNIEVPVVRTVPLASFGQGILRFEDNAGVIQTLTPDQFNAIFPLAGQNPLALAALANAAARYPANDDGGDGLNTGGFRFNAPTTYEQNTHVLRLDWNINDSQRLFLRGNKQHDVLLGVPAFPDTPAPQDWDHNTGVALGHLWTLSSNKINNFRYGLTRQAYTRGGDANENATTFRFVFSPLLYNYSLSRITPVHNFTDDFTWIKGSHTLQFGGNVRIIRNQRSDSSPAFDNAVINPSYYEGSGRTLVTPLILAGYNVSSNNLDIQSTVASLIGRYSQYTANFNYDLDGNVLPPGSIIDREFATEEYDMYVQDSWKIRQNFTLNLGLRYSLSRPVYETGGFQIRPDIPLGDYFDRRVEAARNGMAYNEVLNFELAGPRNNAPGFYSLDKNNFQPRVSAAWSPNFKSGFLGNLFGKNNESVFRGGFAITNDYFGQQLAVTFSGLSTLGFLTSDTIAPNTFNVTDSLGPLFTGFGQPINNFPGMAPLPNRFQTPPDEDTRIELSLDSTLVSPINYSWNFTYGRKLPKGLYIEASYVGRKARNLLVQRDIMAPNNLTDPQSGQDWYTAAGQIYDLYYAGTDVSNVPAIPYFENLFPGIAGFFDPSHSATQTAYIVNQDFAFGDWTFLQLFLDDAAVFGLENQFPNWKNFFYQPQYAAFTAFSTVGRSDYHGGSLSIRQRLGENFLFDFNYTLSKSMDDASGLQTSGAYGSAFILNAIRQEDSYAVSDFDTRHVINANGLWQLPFGRGRQYFSDLNPVADAFLGGWQLGGIFRWNSGLPLNNLIDIAGWATNWQLRSSVSRTRPIQTSPTRGGNGRAPNLFSDLEALRLSVRPARPGETGDRNVFRGNPFSQLDMNLGKTFTMPWSENHKLQFRWEVFNVFNKQYLDEGSIASFGFIPGDPFDPTSESTLTANTGEFTDIKGIPRRMQFVLRYSF